jgi:hypothetical protein
MVLLFLVVLVVAVAQDSGRLVLSFARTNEIRISGDSSLPLVLSFYIPGDTVAIGQAVLQIDRADSFQ